MVGTIRTNLNQTRTSVVRVADSTCVCPGMCNDSQVGRVTLSVWGRQSPQQANRNHNPIYHRRPTIARSSTSDIVSTLDWPSKRRPHPGVAIGFDCGAVSITLANSVDLPHPAAKAAHAQALSQLHSRTTASLTSLSRHQHYLQHLDRQSSHRADGHHKPRPQRPAELTRATRSARLPRVRAATLSPTPSGLSTISASTTTHHPSVDWHLSPTAS